MKQKDVASLILVIGISLLSSWLIFNAILGGSESRSAEVETVNVIESEFPTPDTDIFKKGFLNPTELIRIGESKSTKPFDQ